MRKTEQLYKPMTTLLSGMSSSEKTDQVIPIPKGQKKTVLQFKVTSFGIALSKYHSRNLHLYRFSLFEGQKKQLFPIKNSQIS